MGRRHVTVGDQTLANWLRATRALSSDWLWLLTAFQHDNVIADSAFQRIVPLVVNLTGSGMIASSLKDNPAVIERFALIRDPTFNGSRTWSPWSAADRQ